MTDSKDIDATDLSIAQRWCVQKGADWSVSDIAGRGKTAPVFSVSGPDGQRALKIYDAAFSIGEEGEIQEKRVNKQIGLGVHDCPHLIKVYDGGRFEDRLFLLMNRAPGGELEKRLSSVPRNKIRQIVGQIAEAVIFLRIKGLCHRDIKSANIYISDDFEHATLLDLSVTRDIFDPVGLGTDHSGKLPVLATARYTPPEYLFRILDPSPELWHAIDIYQLGGLLHDLIMREPLFQSEYVKSQDNRYRFAWIIATMTPIVDARDVDQDLIFTARRALDKNWERRSQLSLNDFLANVEAQQARALDALGLSTQGVIGPGPSNSATMMKRVREVATELEPRIVELLSGKGATARHFNDPGSNDQTRRLRAGLAAPTARRAECSCFVPFMLL